MQNSKFRRSARGVNHFSVNSSSKKYVYIDTILQPYNQIVSVDDVAIQFQIDGWVYYFLLEHPALSILSEILFSDAG